MNLFKVSGLILGFLAFGSFQPVDASSWLTGKGPVTGSGTLVTVSYNGLPLHVLVGERCTTAGLGLWDIPGGGCEPSDGSPLDTATREFFQETRVQLPGAPTAYGINERSKNRPEDGRFQTFIYRNAVIDVPAIRASREHSKMGLVDLMSFVDHIRSGFTAPLFTSFLATEYSPMAPGREEVKFWRPVKGTLVHAVDVL
ncbi:MAG: NUDIX hydrolase [Holosporales bacterium]|jgi:8-oxo-dGTP pyrophosphatase MutT (NUDIX family)|nr:NUDIX hydrolase [Holosporales bacterium]